MNVTKIKSMIRKRRCFFDGIEELIQNLSFSKLVCLLKMHLRYSDREKLYKLLAKKFTLRSISTLAKLDKYYFHKIFLYMDLYKKRSVLTYLPKQRQSLITQQLIENSIKIDESHLKYFLCECDLLSQYGIDIEHLDVSEKMKSKMIL